MSKEQEAKGSGAHAAERGEDQFLERFKQKVLHWNRQINLISRVQPELLIQDLIRECLDVLEALPGAVEAWDPGVAASLRGERPDPESSPADVVYIDVGSGAGLPGIVWHHQLTRLLARQAAKDRDPVSTHLVEAREKRAWFLERVGRQLGLSGIFVVNRRWGQEGVRLLLGPGAGKPGTLWLITLKALKMSDTDLLAGWREATQQAELRQGNRLVICRFQPPGLELDESLRNELALPGTDKVEGGACLTAQCGPADAPTATLLLSCYGSGS